MRIGKRRLGAFGVVAALSVGAGGTTAGAQSAAPAPCPGDTVLSDPKGDAQYAKLYAVGTDLDPAAPDSYDVRSVFLTYGAGADGKKLLRAHLVVENLDGTEIVEPWSRQIRYSVEINAGGTYVRPTAISDDGQLTYMYYSDRVAPPAGNPRYLTETATTGSAVTGPMGTLTIDIPADALPDYKPGAEIEANGYSWAHTGTNVGGTLVDYAPDDRAFMPFTVSECAPQAPNNDGGGETPQGDPPQGGQPPSGSSQQPGSKPAKKSARKRCMAKANKKKGKARKKAQRACKKKHRK